MNSTEVFISKITLMFVHNTTGVSQRSSSVRGEVTAGGREALDCS